MKNKTIEILDVGDHKLPIGTKLRQFNNKVLCSERTIGVDNFIIGNVSNNNIVNEVDFSNLPPLYPTKGMEVPEEGIEFTDGVGVVVDVGKYGFSFDGNDVDGNDDEIEYIKWVNSTLPHFQLKRILPKTIQVCAGCFKEACECVREEGWYGVLDGKGVCHWNGETAIGLTSNRECTFFAEHIIDWNNPINVIPEGEV